MNLNILTKFCQCCVSGENLMPIYSQKDLIEPYCNMLSMYFSMQVLESDLLNGQYFICNVCRPRLKDNYLFKCQVEESQKKIKNYFKEKELLDISPLPDTQDYFDSNDSLFKTEYLEEDLEDNSNISFQFPDYIEENDEITNVEYLKDEDYVHSNADDLEFQSPQNNFSFNLVSVEKKNKTITKQPNDLNTHYDVFSKDAYEKNKNLLNSSENYDNKQRKIKINIDQVSKEYLLNYRRLYDRFRYAKAIPFKLDESAIECQICNESFSTHKLLVSHMAVHYANFICDLCGKSFVLRNHLIGHIKRHSLDRISCSVCNKLLKKASLTRHMRMHNGNILVYACPHCDERFKSFSLRINHMAQKHNVDVYKYPCKICSKKFHMASCLSKHVRRCHFQELNATCEECGKGFFDKKSLGEHMLKHSGEKKFHCEICSKYYVRRCSLREHMKIHAKAMETIRLSENSY